MSKPQFKSMTATVRDMARSRGVDYEFTSHAEIEMWKEGIDRLDVRNALCNGRVVEEQRHELDIRYVIVGEDTEERTITVVVEIEDFVLRICVVTTWRGK